MFPHFRSGWLDERHRGGILTGQLLPGCLSLTLHPHPKWHVSPRKSVLIPQHNWPHQPPESQRTLAPWKMNGSSDEPNTLVRLETIYQRSI